MISQAPPYFAPMSTQFKISRILLFACLICNLQFVICNHSLFAASPYTPAQPDPVLEPWRWREYPELKGLGVLCLAEATDGTMWFGIQDGAVAFDGYTWKMYTGDEGPYGPPTVTMTAMKDGSVWAGTHHGISRFRDGVWKRMYPPEGDLPWATFKIIERKDGSIWAATDWGALRFDSDGVTLLTSSDMAHALKTLAPYAQTEVISDEIIPKRDWSTGIGVDAARRSRGNVYRYISPMVVWNIAANSPGDRAGLKVGDRITHVYNRMPRSQLDLMGRVGTPINVTVEREGNSEPFEVHMTREMVDGHYREFVLHDVYEDRDENLWFGFAAGDLLRHNKDGTWTYFNADDGMNMAMLPRICHDSKGMIWTLAHASRKINRFDGKVWTQTSLPGGVAKYKFVETPDNALWVVSWQSLNVLRDGEWKLYEWIDAPLPTDRLPDALLASDGALWFISLRGYAVRLDLSDQWTTYGDVAYECTTPDGSRWFMRFREQEIVRQQGAVWTKYGVGDGLMDKPYRVYATRNGDLWVVGSHKDIAATARFVNERWQLKTHPQFAHRVMPAAIFEDAKNNIWFGSPNPIYTNRGHFGGLLSYAPETDMWTHHKPPNWPIGSYGMGQTPDGTMWFGGTMFRKHDGEKLMGVTEPSDFSMTATDAVLITPDGDLWAGTRSEGIFRFDGQAWARYNTRDGLAGNRVIQVLHMNDGSILANTVGGVSRFDGSTWTSHVLPKVVTRDAPFGFGFRQGPSGALWIIRRIRKKGESAVYTTRYMSDNQAPETQIVSSFDRVSFPGNTSLRWQGADRWYATPVADLRYSWRLNDEEWSPYSKETSRDFLELPAGEYTFEVRARDLDFNEDPTPAVVHFIVDPPVYKQAWFIALMCVVLGITGFQAFRILSNNRELRVANVRIREADRAKSRFLANMSHELRTPLNGILGYAQILDRDPKLDNKQRDGVGVIHRSGEHLLALINDVLDLSRIEAQKTELELTEFHLPTFLRGIADMARIRAEQKGIAFQYETPNVLPAGVLGDERRLRQVLINLLGNAVKFTEKGHVLFTVNADNDRITFAITDTGVGIAPEQMDAIFKPFEQVGDASHRAEGTGLGLTISHELVQLMGDNIQVSSTLGEGSEFRFEIALPPVPGWEMYREEQTQHPIGFEGEKNHILIVDDRLENRQVLVNLLSPVGFEIEEATNGREAVNQALENTPDLILMDLVMPTLDGFEATRQIKDAAEDVVIIALSASVLDQNRNDSLEAGCDDFIPKPVNADLLFDKIATYLNITWTYDAEPEQTRTDQTMIAPPQNILVELDAFTQKGQIVAIEECIKNIEQLGEAYHPFASHLKQCADNFDLKGIREFIGPYLENAE